MEKKRKRKNLLGMLDKRGIRIDHVTSLPNLRVAIACELQRQESGILGIPVLSMVELTDKALLDDKLEAFQSDYFTVLKDHADTYKELQELTLDTWEENNVGALRNMINNAWEWTNYPLLDLWALTTAKEGDMIYFKRRIAYNVSAKAYRDRGEDSLVLEATDEYVLRYVVAGKGDERHVMIDGAFPL
ncbi:MAG: hypothetical protein K6E47_14595 [Lachnospiraceae bacterium]|nr:hypothetical protein [Lachnospiraceae bacterium]